MCLNASVSDGVLEVGAKIMHKLLSDDAPESLLFYNRMFLTSVVNSGMSIQDNR